MLAIKANIYNTKITQFVIIIQFAAMLLKICSSYFIFYIFFHLANPVESGVGQHPTTQLS